MSGFSYPIGAILVNILSSRGNSKAFLKLEIYKKTIVAINIFILYLWGIESFLYGLVVVSLFNVSLNILFASREIKLPLILFIKPIVIQMCISIIAVLATVLITENIEQMDIIMFLLKGSIFTLLYILFNYIMKTSSFDYVLQQIMPALKKLRNRVSS